MVRVGFNFGHALTQINWNSLKVLDYFQYPLRGISTLETADISFALAQNYRCVIHQ